MCWLDFFFGGAVLLRAKRACTVARYVSGATGQWLEEQFQKDVPCELLGLMIFVVADVYEGNFQDISRL